MKSEKNITMYDYILEEEGVLKNIIHMREQIADKFSSLLQEKNPREIVICGSGTSCHAAMAVRQFWEKLFHVRVRAEFAMDFKDCQEVYDNSMILIGISQGGQSLSTIEAIKKGKENHIPTVGISENTEAELFRYTDLQILMECGDEKSVAKTKGYIATVGILFILGLESAHKLGKISASEKEHYLSEMQKTAENFPRIIEGAREWLLKNKKELISAKRMIVVGYGNQCATVREGALKMLETMRYGIYGYDLEEFCHGVYNSVDQDTFLIYIVSEGGEQEKILHLRDVLDSTTAHQFLISGTGKKRAEKEKDCILPFIEKEYFSVLEYIIPMQVIASVLPYELGINPFIARDPLFHQKMGSKLV